MLIWRDINKSNELNLSRPKKNRWICLIWCLENLSKEEQNYRLYQRDICVRIRDTIRVSLGNSSICLKKCSWVICLPCAAILIVDHICCMVTFINIKSQCELSCLIHHATTTITSYSSFLSHLYICFLFCYIHKPNNFINFMRSTKCIKLDHPMSLLAVQKISNIPHEKLQRQQQQQKRHATCFLMRQKRIMVAYFSE